jgi:hypothetical protein
MKKNRAILKMQHLVITLLSASLPLITLSQQNLVVNGGFEKGDQIPSWHYRQI